MSKYLVSFISLHPINLPGNSAEAIDLGTRKTEVIAYSEDLIDTLMKQDSHRVFRFRAETTEVRHALSKMLNSEEESATQAQTIADRLLNTEQRVDERYQKITDILQGSLLQVFFQYDGNSYVMLTKLDHHAFLDEEDLTKRIGLPYEKRVLKGCLIDTSIEGWEKVRVYDTNAQIARYWWDYFLELEEERSDAMNTRTAFTALRQFLDREIKRKSKRDFVNLRNDLLSYFRTNSECEYKDLIQTLFGNYTPSTPTIDIKKIKDKVKKLPETKGFDGKFTIKRSELRGYKETVALHASLDLVLKADIPDLNHVITPFEEDGLKGIKIRSESGWKYFAR